MKLVEFFSYIITAFNTFENITTIYNIRRRSIQRLKQSLISNDKKITEISRKKNIRIIMIL